MNEFIQPYQYNFLETQALTLLQTNQHVNDSATIATMRALVSEKIALEFRDCQPAELAFLMEILSIQKSRKEVEAYLAKVKGCVRPFMAPSDQRLKKVFQKTKKLQFPKWESLALKDYTFYGWNNSGQQRKYLILYQNGELVGVEGTFSPTLKKGVCAICHKTADLTSFTAKVKSSGDGRYLNHGNYICYDSETCNHQIEQVTELFNFFEFVRPKK